MSKLVVLSGVPGSGKSYFSKKLRQQKESHVYIISSDALRDLVTGNQKNLSEDKMIWKMFYDLAKVYSIDPKGIVVLDSTNRNAMYRIDTIKDIKDMFDETDLVIFDIPEEVIYRQNLDREYPIPEDILKIYINDFEKPSKKDYEFFNNVYIVNGDNILDIIEKL